MDFHRFGLLSCKCLPFVSLRIPKATPDVAYSISWDVGSVNLSAEPKIPFEIGGQFLFLGSGRCAI